MSKITPVGDLVVWNFTGWNVGTANEKGEILDVLCMDLPTKRDAVSLAEMHQAGRVDLRQHESFDHYARIGGSRGWGGYAPIYQHTSHCSCGWSADTVSKAEGRKDRADHILDVALVEA